MDVEARLESAGAVFGLSITGEGYQPDRLPGPVCPDPARYFIAVEPRQAYIDEHDIRHNRGGLVDTGIPVGRLVDVVTIQGELGPKHGASVLVVFDDEDSPARGSRGRGERRRSCLTRPGDAREVHGEDATLAKPFTPDGHRTSMQHDEGFHDGEADSQSALGTVKRALALDEEVKAPPEETGRESGARIRDLQDGLSVLLGHSDGHAAAGRRVFQRIAHETLENLLPSRLICIDPDRVDVEIN